MEEMVKNQYKYLISWIIFGIALGSSYNKFCRANNFTVTRMDLSDASRRIKNLEARLKDIKLLHSTMG
ncbi:hypothetical protein K7432_007890 [Basidiobolus ranarum]|uniref:ATP synthase F0 subunit 8 n=1 Tax=Basidiobolus ranarum TaxID=34480 RepID=A0ABR2WSN1_9FUNG